MNLCEFHGTASVTPRFVTIFLFSFFGHLAVMEQWHYLIIFHIANWKPMAQSKVR